MLDVASIDRAAALRIRAEARALLADSFRWVGEEPARATPSDVLVEQAMARYESVLALQSDDPTLWVELGLTRARFHRVQADGRSEERIDGAIAALERARALSAETAEVTVASELASLRAHRADFAGAAAEWEHAWQARETAPPLILAQPSLLPMTTREVGLLLLLGGARQPDTTILANWAEMQMLSGDAAGAIERYRRAIATAPAPSLSAALARWGLALAEERSGAHEDALETVLEAVEADRARLGAGDEAAGDFAALHDDAVFFEPACEIHAYEALGHEALATRASTDEGRAAAWTQALRSTRYFLAEGGRASLYADTARDAEARLSARLAR